MFWSCFFYENDKIFIYWVDQTKLVGDSYIFGGYYKGITAYHDYNKAIKYFLTIANSNNYAYKEISDIYKELKDSANAKKYKNKFISESKKVCNDKTEDKYYRNSACYYAFLNEKKQCTKQTEHYARMQCRLSVGENVCDNLISNIKSCFEGYSFEQRVQFFIKDLDNACNANTDICLRIAWLYNREIDNSSSNKNYLFSKYLEYAEKSCEGSGKGCQKLANSLYYQSNSNKDYKKILRYYKKACEYELSGGYYENLYSSCLDTAEMYRYGVEKVIGINHDEAKRYYKKACDLGDEPACSALDEF